MSSNRLAPGHVVPPSRARVVGMIGFFAVVAVIPKFFGPSEAELRQTLRPNGSRKDEISGQEQLKAIFKSSNLDPKQYGIGVDKSDKKH